MPLTSHLDHLTATVSQVRQLPHVLADLAHLPPGDSGEAEAAALDALNVRRDGTTQDPTAKPTDALEEAIRAAAEPAARSFRGIAHALVARLDHLAGRGVRRPDSVLPSDFNGRVICPTRGDNPHAPPTAWGDYVALKEGHPLKVRLRKEDAYEHEGHALAFMGRAITGEAGSRPLPWLPIAEAIKGTLSLSTPQKTSRAEQKARKQTEQDARREAWEDSKSAHVKRLEAEIAELKAQRAVGAA
jgi:hypothetical protein